MNLNENGGNDCPVLCEGGECVNCLAGDVRCNQGVPQNCVNGEWANQGAACANYCAVLVPTSKQPEARCFTPSSCALPFACGQDRDSCCFAPEVTGGTFNRSNQNAGAATVSTFSMDKYEVTNGRLAQFLANYYLNNTQKIVINAGDGKSPNIAGDPGWQPGYSLPPTYAAMIEQLKCAGEDAAPTDNPAGGSSGSGGLGSSGSDGGGVDAGGMSGWGGAGGSGGSAGTSGGSAGAGMSGVAGGTTNLPPSIHATFFSQVRSLPANCVDYYTAYAFCIADGGRLPTEAEWNYAAAAGAQQRYYPWSTSPLDTLIDHKHAAHDGDDISPVGTFPSGEGFFHQLDLAGNVSEWTLDSYAKDYIFPCQDCLAATPAASRVRRGGSYASQKMFLNTGYRGAGWGSIPLTTVGFRCVHDSKVILK